MAARQTKTEILASLDEFTSAYITTALWSTNDESTPSGGYPLDRNYSADDISKDTLAKIIADCAKFQQENATQLADENCLKYGPDFGPAGRAGHDFWLTRNGHGTGFWDGDWEKSAGQLLTAASHKFGEVNLYVSRGKIYCD